MLAQACEGLTSATQREPQAAVGSPDRRRDRNGVRAGDAEHARRALLPMRKDVHGVTLNHVRRGAGEPLLLIHGIGGEWRSWEPVIGRLSAVRDVIAIDMH